MGIIIRQGIKHSIVRYSAIFLGLLSTLFIYPLVLNEIGLIRTIQAIALVAAPLVLMGSNIAATRFFPTFKSTPLEQAGFFTRLNRTSLGGAILVTLLYFLFQEPILQAYNVQDGPWKSIFNLTPAFIILLAFSQLYEFYTSNYQRIAIPAAIGELSLKVGLPLLFILYLNSIITFQTVVYLFLLVYVALDLGLLVYLKTLVSGPLFTRIPKISTTLRSEIRNFSAYNVFTSLSILVSVRIDLIMLSAMTNFTTSGIYSINMMIGEVIDAPRQALIRITNPIIAEAMKQEDHNKIAQLYQSTSLHMFMASLLLFVGILSSIDDLFSIMPNGDEVAKGKMVLIILGVTKLVDNVFGINSIILQHSKWYRFLLAAVVFLASFNIFNNYLLIPKYEMIGAATATLISGIGFNLMKYIRIRQTLKIQPFTWRIPVLLLIGIAAFALGLLIPAGEAETIWMACMNIGGRSILVGSFFVLLIYSLKLSPEVNGLIRNFASSIIKR